MSLIPSASVRTVIRIVVSKALQQSIFLVIGVVVVVALIVVATSASPSSCRSSTDGDVAHKTSILDLQMLICAHIAEGMIASAKEQGSAVWMVLKTLGAVVEGIFVKVAGGCQV